MADARMTIGPGVNMIGKSYQQGPDVGCMVGNPNDTAVGVRLFGQPHISKATNGGMPALNPIAGAYNFSYNWGAHNALNLTRKTGDCPLSQFEANHAKPLNYVSQGPNNIPVAGATAVPKEAFALMQKDARIERGNVATDITMQPRYIPTQRGTPDATTKWGQDVYAQKQQRALNSFKQVNARLRALRAATQQPC